jgi:uncharacterized protein YdcH (DUF465 family)
MDGDALIERLTAENEEFRRLRAEHHAQDLELQELTRQVPLTSEAQWRISELKKLKLIAKDSMEAILRQARHSVTA